MNDISNEKNGFEEDVISYDYYYDFPKKYERRLLGSIDKRFALILLGSFIVHFVTAFYFAINPPRGDITEQDIVTLQEQYVNLILDKETEAIEIEDEDLAALAIDADESVATGEKIEGAAQGASKPGGGASSADASGDASRSQTSGQRRSGSRSSGRSASSGGGTATLDVSNEGLLGMLTSSAETSTGNEAADILSEVDAGGGDLDKALSGVERIKTGTPGATGGTGSSTGTGTGGRDVKGSRSSTSEGIGGVISGRGTAKSKDIDRQGGFVVSAVSEVANEDGNKNQSRNPDEVSAVINTHNSAIQYCYQRELKRNPDLRGKIVIRFTIAPNGRVSEAKILSSTVNNQRVERCVLNRVRRWDDFGAIDPSLGNATFRQVYSFGY